MEENVDIIEIEGQEYVVCDKFLIDEKQYWLIMALLENDVPSNEVEVVRVDGDMLFSVDDLEEQKKVQQVIEQKIKETAD